MINIKNTKSYYTRKMASMKVDGQTHRKEAAGVGMYKLHVKEGMNKQVVKYNRDEWK